MEVRPNDLISGAMYLKFINDYKEYDKKQKDKLEKLQKKVEFLEWENDDLRIALEESECPDTSKLRTKLKNQRVALDAYHKKIKKLEQTIEDLTIKIGSQFQELESLKQNNHPQNQEED